jgi:hypothetical protein
LDDNPFNRTATLQGVLRDYFLTSYLVFWRALRDGLRAWLPVRSTGAAGVATMHNEQQS